MSQPTDDLRTRIAATVYRHILFRALDQCECGKSFDGFCGRSLDAYSDHVADEVIRDVLTPEWLADLVIQAVQKAADDILVPKGHTIAKMATTGRKTADD